jgi:hypothetical protein
MAITSSKTGRKNAIPKSNGITIQPVQVNKGFLRSLADPQDKLFFQFNPTEFGYSKGAEYSEKKIPGLSSPLYQFSNGSKKPINIITEWLDLCPPKGKDPNNPKTLNKIEAAIKWLESKCHNAQKANSLSSAPEVLVLNFGASLNRVRIDHIEVKIDRFYPNMRPRHAVITISMFQVIDQHQGPADILKKYFF